MATKTNLCCTLVLKFKQYVSKQNLIKIDILQFESNRLSTLQLECNQLLDTFYSLKEEYDYLVNELLTVKYLGMEDKTKCQIYESEFNLFIKNIWQVGKMRFSERRQRAKYNCFVGIPLTEVMATVQTFIDEVMLRLPYMPYHTECATALHTICSQIQTELSDDCLGTADACFRQFVYLQSAIPFLQELKGLVNQYILLPNVHTPKEVVDNIILQIPCINNLLFEKDSDEMIPFRFLINLLNGKLFDNDILEHNSEIRPIVEDDINLKRSTLVMKVAEWIMQQYKIQDVSTIQNTLLSPVKSNDLIDGKIPCYLELNHTGSPFYSQSPMSWSSHCDIVDTMEALDVIKFDWEATCNSVLNGQRKISRRGRKTGHTNNISYQGSDLQPIKLDTLQTPFLPPLL